MMRCPRPPRPLTEGVTPAGQALNVTTVTAEVHQYGGWVPLTDMLDLTAIDNNIVQATNVLGKPGRPYHGHHCARYPERRHQRDLCTEDRNGRRGDRRDQPCGSGCHCTADGGSDRPGSGAAADPERRHPLATALWPLCTRTPATISARTRTGSRRTSMRHPEEIFNGEIGKINNVRFVVSSEAKVWKGDRLPGGAGCVQHAGTGCPRLRDHRTGRAAVCSTL